MNLQFYLTESKLSCHGIVIGTFFNYLDFPTHYICGTMKCDSTQQFCSERYYNYYTQYDNMITDSFIFLIYLEKPRNGGNVVVCTSRILLHRYILVRTTQIHYSTHVLTMCYLPWNIFYWYLEIFLVSLTK